MFSFKAAMLFWFSVSLVPIYTSIVYFLSSPRSESFAKRLAVSAHGIVISVLFIVAVIAAAFGFPQKVYRELFDLLCWMPIILIGYSFSCFEGGKEIHLLQAINILWLLAAAIFARVAVIGA